MTVLMLTDRFPPEVRSSAHLYHELACGLKARGHEVRVITKVPSKYTTAKENLFRKESRNGWETLDGIPVRRVRWIPYINGSRAVRALDHLTLWAAFALAGRESPHADVVLIYSPPLPLALAGRAYQWLRGTPFVLNVQDLYPQTVVDLGLLRGRLAIRAAEGLESATYRFARRIVVHSPGNREFLVSRKGVPAEKVRVIHNWVDVERIRPGPKENGFRHSQGLTGKFVVSFAGLMGYAQDLSPIIEAAELLQVHPNIIFLLVGEGVTEERWKALVSAKGLLNVRFLPLVPKGAYAELLSASDVCLVPLAGGLRTPVVPGKLQSIMAGGRPVIATLNLGGDASKIINEARCGFAIDPSKPREVAEAILRLYELPGLARQMGMNGRAYAEKNFSISACCAAYERLFEEIEAERRATPA